MQILPELRWGLLNGWLFVVACFIGLAVTVISFSPEKRKRLFFEPMPPAESPWRFYLAVGRVAAVSYHLLMIATPLQIGMPLCAAGLLIYLVGYAIVILSLNAFKRSPADGMVRGGLYEHSRNPQWVGLVLVFLGTTLAVGSWLHLALQLILMVAYHFQILTEEIACAEFYGEEYRAYFRRVPRYWFWF